MYRDTGLQFQTKINISLEIARCAEDRIWRLRSTHVLEHGMIRCVQVAAVHLVTLYAADI